jgi:hypothetical protein
MARPIGRLDWRWIYAKCSSKMNCWLNINMSVPHDNRLVIWLRLMGRKIAHRTLMGDRICCLNVWMEEVVSVLTGLSAGVKSAGSSMIEERCDFFEHLDGDGRSTGVGLGCSESETACCSPGPDIGGLDQTQHCQKGVRPQSRLGRAKRCLRLSLVWTSS